MDKSNTIKNIFLYLSLIVLSIVSVTLISKSMGLTDLNMLVILNKSFIIFAFYVLFKIQKKDFFQYIKFNATKHKDTIYLIVSSFVISILVLGSVFTCIILLTDTKAVEIFRRYNLLSLLMFATIIIAPITEEIVFRGIIFNKLKEGFSRKSALYIQAILFALIHVNPLQVAYTFIFGLFFGKIYDRTNSIIGAILSHMIINFVGSYGLSWFFYTFIN